MNVDEFEEVKTMILKLKHDLNVEKDEKFELQNKLKSIAQKSGEKQVQAENTERTKGWLSQQMNELKDGMDILKQDRVRLGDWLEQTKEENERLAIKLNRTEQELENAKDFITQLNTELAALNEFKSQSETLTRDLARLRDEKDRMTDELDKTSKQCRDMTRAMDLKKDEVLRIRRELDASEMEKNRLWDKLQRGDNENYVERTEFERVKDEHDRLLKKVDVLLQKNEQAKDTTDEQFREIRSLKEQLADFQAFQKQYESLKDDSTNNLDAIGDVNRELMMTKQQFDMLRSDNHKVLRDNERLKVENDTLWGRIRSSQSERNLAISSIAVELERM